MSSDTDTSRLQQIYRVTIIGSVANLLLVLFKFFAGIAGRSSAMLADAVHSLSDLISDVIVLLFVRISGKPEDADHDYGHGKYETLASVLVGLLLGIAGALIGIDAVLRALAWWRGDVLAAPNGWALSAAVISIVVKEILFRYTIRQGRHLESPALVANAWHHRSDAFTSIATLVGIGGAMLLGDKGRVLDPIAAFIVSGFIIHAAYTLTRPGIDQLLEKSLSADDKAAIAEIVTSTPGVVKFHRLRTRNIGSHRAIELHIKMPGDYTLRRAHEIASDVERRLKDRFGPATHIAIHMEPAD